tara:strand:+ start:873 stop:1121 length:249 start_codon:yes stop_codon:yes gene_type:complete
MENTTQDLYKESVSARINRLEQTIQELKNLNSMLIKGQEIDKRAYKQATEIRDKKINNLEMTVNSLIDQVNYWKDRSKTFFK